MSAMILDVAERNLPANVGNAIASGGRNILKVVELQYKYGAINGDGHQAALDLTRGKNGLTE